ncbi:MAG: hypothetical protein OER21_05070 [Gemmatimonadota bacterium]|nr:hypothetical protein [Gemmatimonadota bacterium]
MQTGGGDVFDTYFSHRNQFSRGPDVFEPTELELRYERATGAVTRGR